MLTAPSLPDDASRGVAIVGMACVFPGAPDLATYWENILAKVDAVGDPPEEWDANFYYDATSGANDRTYCKRGGYLGELAQFNPLEYGVMPNSVDGGEPDHFLALRVASEALDDAGYEHGASDGRRVEVVLGRGTYINRGYTNLVQHGMVIDQTLRILQELHPEHTKAELRQLKRTLKESLPPFNAEVAPGLVPNIITGRIANRLDLMGPNYIIDAACASSLIAVDRGVQDLLVHRCDLAVVGGVHASTPALIHMIFSQLGAMSHRGEIRPFDTDADGTLLGEGVGVMVIKRLDDAERDGDRVYAVVKGVGTASDGRSTGLLAPRVEGEELSLRLAYEAAGISPGSVGLIEAHGTATAAGDLNEIRALRRVFGDRDSTGSPSIAVGTVKSMISHLLPAAGVAGLIKAALALYHKVLPPTLHCDQPNPTLELEKTPFYLNTETRPWIHGGPFPRRAGVNAFGFGGINAHAVLEEHTGTESTGTLQQRWDSEVCVLQADSRQALVRDGRRLLGWLEAAPGVCLRDVAHTLGTPLGVATRRLAVVATSPDDLRRKLGHAVERLSDEGRRRIRDRSGIYYFDQPLSSQGKLAVLFPGEGSQSTNMLADLCIHFPTVRAWFDLMDRAFTGRDRKPLLSEVVFPPPNGEADARRGEEQLWQMDYGAEAVFAANQGLWSLLAELGVRPDGVVGHSTGEYSALLASGAIRFGDDREMIQRIVDLHEIYRQLDERDEIPRAGLVAVGGIERAAVTALVAERPGRLFLAMDNCPQQMVVCGTASDFDFAVERLREQGAVCTPLPFARAYHTPMFEPVRDRLRAFFDSLPVGTPSVELYSCASASRYPDDPDRVRELAVDQWAVAVRFRDTIEEMYEAGYRIFVEAGPKGALTAFVDDILRDRPHLAVAAGGSRHSGIRQLNDLAGQLVAHGVQLQLEPLWSRRAPKRLDFAVSPVEDGSARPSAPVRLATGLTQLRLPTDRSNGVEREHAHRTSAEQPEAPAVSSTSADHVTTAPGPRGAIMGAYLETMERFLDVQAGVVGELVARGDLSGRPEMVAHVAPEASNGATTIDGASTGPQRSRRSITDTAALPFVGEIISLTPGAEVVSRRTMHLAEDLFLRDHTLGGRVSAHDDSLTALPVVPLTMSMEMLAEVASLLVPGAVVIGMRDIRAYRWLSLNEGSVTLQLKACRRSHGAGKQVEIAARIDDVGDGSARRPLLPIIEGTVVLSSSYPLPPPAGEFALRGDRPSTWARDELYTHGMFHGPSFRGVESVDRWGEDGTEATLVARPREGLFASHRAPSFLIDPVLLDAAGQLLGYWTAEHLDTGFNVFPFRVRAVHVYRPALVPPERATARARIVAPDEGRIIAGLDIIDAEGRLAARVEGWEDRRFELPHSFYRLRIAPRDVTLAQPWGAPVETLGRSGAVACCVLDALRDEFLEAHGGIWEMVLAHLVLSRQERDDWRRIVVPEARREWLVARSSAKDAVRLLAKRRDGVDLYPADVRIDADGDALAVTGVVLGLGTVPVVSVAAVDGVAVAAAADPARCRGVGVQVERLATDIDVNAAPETVSLRALGLPCVAEWVQRLRCATSAAARAARQENGGVANGLVVRSGDAGTGRMTFTAGDGPGDHVAPATSPITAWTGREKALIVSLATR